MFRTVLCTKECTNANCPAMKFVDAWREKLVEDDILFAVRTRRKIFSPHGSRYPNSEELLRYAEANADRTLFYFGVR